jgi:hypothetical protein
MADPQRLSRVFVELADTLVREFDIVEFLTMLANRTCELLHATEAGVILADEGGVLRPVASSHETARMLELFELQNQEGPCLDCYQDRRSIVNVELADTSERWPRFTAEAQRCGFVMVHALPMRLRDEVVGAVNIFDTDVRPLTVDEIDIGQALADVATVGLLQERSIREARVLNEQLQGALQSRIVIEQAKGMLAERLTLDMDAAFAHLRGHARRTHQRLGAVCEAVLNGQLGADDFLADS